MPSSHPAPPCATFSSHSRRPRLGCSDLIPTGQSAQSQSNGLAARWQRPVGKLTFARGWAMPSSYAWPLAFTHIENISRRGVHCSPVIAAHGGVAPQIRARGLILWNRQASGAITS